MFSLPIIPLFYCYKTKNSQPRTIIGANRPITIPMVKKSLASSLPLEYIIAFGGVDTGNAIAKEALRAIVRAASTKESLLNATLSAITIGSIILAAAVLLIKFDTATTK
jgi:hypothetical protein